MNKFIFIFIFIFIACQSFSQTLTFEVETKEDIEFLEKKLIERARLNNLSIVPPSLQNKYGVNEYGYNLKQLEIEQDEKEQDEKELTKIRKRLYEQNIRAEDLKKRRTAVRAIHGETVVSFITNDGEEYKNVSLIRVEPNGITIRTTNSLRRIMFENLDDEWREKFLWDPIEATAFEENINKANYLRYQEKLKQEKTKQEKFNKEQQEKESKSKDPFAEQLQTNKESEKEIKRVIGIRENKGTVIPKIKQHEHSHW